MSVTFSWGTIFSAFKVMTKVQQKLHLQLQLHKNFNVKYNPRNKLTLLPRKRKFLGLEVSVE